MSHRISTFVSLAVLAVSTAFAHPANGEGSAELLDDLRITWQGDGLFVLPSEKQDQAFQLECQGEVAIEGKRFRARAERVQFDAKENVLTLESDGPVFVELEWRNDGDRVAARLSAQRIVLWINDGRFQLEKANVVVQASAKPDD
jgi:hypothetical protein